MTQWLYIFGEPKRHPDVFEIGHTRKTVEERNRAKRSIDKWVEMARYPVADSREAEADLIRRTKKYRYRNRREILQIPYDKLERIATEVAEKHSCVNYEIQQEMAMATREYDKTEYGPALKRLQDQHKEEADWIKNKHGDPYGEHRKSKSTFNSWIYLPMLIAGCILLYSMGFVWFFYGLFPMIFLIELMKEQTDKPSEQTQKRADKLHKAIDSNDQRLKELSESLWKKRDKILSDYHKALVIEKKAEKMFGKAKA